MEYEDRYQHVPKPKYDCLLFDVDDTLYPLHSGLSDQVTKNIIEYMNTKLGIPEDKVPEMCVRLYKEYGTTMAGLRIFSNANEEHVETVLGRLGLEDCFEGVICFETLNPINKTDAPDNEDNANLKGSKLSTDFIEKFCATSQVLPKTPVVCKPFEYAFEQAFKIAKINPQRTLFFDDSIRNLQTGKGMGLHTIWVGSSHRTKDVDYALESIHNMREALPELWEAIETMEEVHYSEMVAMETPVRA
ncbi:haloacid dehalogenase-like hydrolase (HAD) superfamily protein [Actinidia rufa]|uniref:Haloacid dehalogenase-like hydrolase (HAD) superfamily protein n=1 Tax=Actinidia rufa TaxID=165716 RepID=A0A7J0DP76_9ERIC|nr:haloacid dehalogenase-like hydrolase (HAD) superfamily protein [Actinidia rufa]